VPLGRTISRSAFGSLVTCRGAGRDHALRREGGIRAKDFGVPDAQFIAAEFRHRTVYYGAQGTGIKPCHEG
jgi:hypothetical protein